MLTRDPAQDQITQIGAALQETALTRPTTERVNQAFRDEALYGVGTLNADILSAETQKSGQRISYDDWKQSPYFDESITYYPSMTIDGAIAHKEMVDFTRKNAEVINRATLGQTVQGYANAFVAGMAEPKNLMAGVAASAVLSPVGGGAITGIKSAKNLVKINRNMRRYGDIAARGFGEGLVAATLMEPSNRSSAAVLQQEYTLADSLWNVGLSSVLGGGLAVAPAIIRDKVRRHGPNTAEVVAEEIDLAVSQMAEGKKVDVDIVDQVRSKPEVAAEQWARYTETPEFKARFEGSKVVDAQGAPLRVYHGTRSEFDKHEIRKRSAQLRGAGVYFSDDTARASMYAEGEGGNLRPAYLNMKNPLIADPIVMERIKAEGGVRAGKEMSQYLQSKGYDGVIYSDTINNRREYVVFSPEQVISAFGADDLTTIKARMRREQLEKIEAAQKPEASIAIDSEGVTATERRIQDMPDKPDYQKSFDTDMERIRAMVDDEIIPKAIYDEFMEAIDGQNPDDISEAFKTLEGCILRG